jgi:hypothetical protein
MRDKIRELVKLYPNDFELGGEFRKSSKSYSMLWEFICNGHPNDFDLGGYLRKFVRVKPNFPLYWEHEVNETDELDNYFNKI